MAFDLLVCYATSNYSFSLEHPKNVLLPQIGGAAIIVRQYLVDGFYPTVK